MSPLSGLLGQHPTANDLFQLHHLFAQLVDCWVPSLLQRMFGRLGGKRSGITFQDGVSNYMIGVLCP